MTTAIAMKPQSVRLVGELQRQSARAKLDNMPIDPADPIEVVFRKVPPIRKPDANARMWAGPLKDIAEQAWINGQQFKDIVWHEHFKELFLPEDDDPELHLLAKEGYQKWTISPSGQRRCTGSTTDLLKRGFALYTLQVEAFGASLGVQFSVSPREYGQ